MSSKKWVVMFFIFSLITFGGIIGFNVIVDPFGVFGDYFVDWYTYNMTQNPRVAKVSYIDKEHENYDSYIIGCSSTSSYPVELLNKYTGDKFYNMIMYGADIYDSTETAKYLINNYEVKNLFLAVYLSNAVKYDYEYDDLMDNLHQKVENGSIIDFYSKYLFLHPHYGIEKIKAKFEDSYLQNKNDVFNVETGAYDKSKRDIEPIGSLEEYFEVYPVFTNYPYMKYDELSEIDNCLKSIAELKRICDENGINFKVILTPLYVDYAKYYDQEDIDLFKTKLASITDFWDFSLSSVSTEPRYFYDEAHFRNLVGEMAIARMYGDDSVYMPEDFGRYITSENVEKNLVEVSSLKADDSGYTKEVPILMYDRVKDKAKFEKQINGLISKGYEFITFEDMKRYVEGKFDIPQKSVVLALDEGNVNSFDEIYGVLKKNGINATVFIDEENFAVDYTGAFKSKLEVIKGYDLADIELKAGRMWYSDEDKFISGLRRKVSNFESFIGEDVDVVWYGNDVFDELTEVVLKEEGISFSLVNKEGPNTLVKGVNQSLRGLKVFYVSENDEVDFFVRQP